MSAVIAPGVVPGLAPPAPEAPPASTGPEGRSPATGKTFADTVAEHRATQEAADHAATGAGQDTATPPAPQAASEPNAPPGEPTAETTSAEAAGLIALVQDLLQANTGPTTETPATDVPSLDRPAGAGDTETGLIDVNAMEALMAQSLLMRTPAPDADVTIAPIAVAAVSAEAPASDATSTLNGLQQAITELAGAGAPVEATTDAIAPAITSTDTLTGTTGTLDVLAPAPATPAAEAATTGATAQAVEAAQAQPYAALVAAGTPDGAPEDAALQPEPRVEAVTPPVATSEAPASTVVEGDETAALPGLPAATVESALDEGGQPASRRTRVEATDARAMPPSAPAVQGEHLAATASTTRVEVATGGAVTSQIASTVQSAVLRGEHEVRLVLNPPELGRVEIQIVESSGGVRVHMLADQPGARDLIERQLPLLQQALAARDVRVERMEVGRPGDAASAQQWSNSQGSNDGQRQRGQQDGQRNGSPDWSPLAAMGMGLAESVRVDRPKAGVAGSLDVMA